MIELKELSLVRRLNRASGKMRYLFPVIPHYWIWKTKYYTAYRSWFESSFTQGYDPFESFVLGNENITCVIYINKSLQESQVPDDTLLNL